MTEVFITDIQKNEEVHRVWNSIKKTNPGLKLNCDLIENSLPFPCGHTVIRVEGNDIDPDKILALVRDHGFRCEIMEDKICSQSS